MAKDGVEIGDIFVRLGEPKARAWRVEHIFELPEGTHARLVRLDDPSRMITLAANAVLDPRLMTWIGRADDGG
ncbi:MAG TPA: hypothetical protein VF342_14090 [Alphaproteobacteria bacterium]